MVEDPVALVVVVATTHSTMASSTLVAVLVVEEEDLRTGLVNKAIHPTLALPTDYSFPVGSSMVTPTQKPATTN